MATPKRELYTGVTVLKGTAAEVNELYKKGELPYTGELFPNQCVVLKSGKQSALAMFKNGALRLLPQPTPLFNIMPKNKEQQFTIALLRDPSIDMVTITGCPGSGKTLLALAYAMEQINKGEINKIVLCKNFTPLGREIGFLKGDLFDKVKPWLGNFYDNFEVLGVPSYELDSMSGEDPLYRKENPGKRIEMSPVTFLQGRSISNAVIIVDEVQNLPQDVVKQILSRPAEKSKIVLLGDPDQVFEKGVSVSQNGLIAAVEAGKECEFIGHIHMLKSERSRLAQWAWEKL